MWIIVALISGALMSVQGVFNTEVTKQSGIWVSASFVQFTALLTCLVAWFVTGRDKFSAIAKVDNKYMLLGGVIGAFITYTVIKSMENAGPAQAVLAIIISQLIVAYLIELFGLFGVEKAEFSWQKLIGALVAIAGFVIFKWEKS
ncbi:MAG: DMT family transporter [Lachnospiraceae bacterium]|nr:DMT family transporter [Lachnospiraceae bacterium]